MDGKGIDDRRKNGAQTDPEKSPTVNMPTAEI